MYEDESFQDSCSLSSSTEEAKSLIFGMPDSTVPSADEIQSYLSIQEIEIKEEPVDFECHESNMKIFFDNDLVENNTASAENDMLMRSSLRISNVRSLMECFCDDEAQENELVGGKREKEEMIDDVEDELMNMKNESPVTMFSSASALESHMKDHGIEDPADQEGQDSGSFSLPRNARVRCPDCEKDFSNLQNVKRHANDAHQIKYYTCTPCVMFFKKGNEFAEHYKTYHHQNIPKSLQDTQNNSFYAAYMNQHCVNVHGVDYNGDGQFECNLCFRKFEKESSLSAHKGWHFRLKTNQTWARKRMSRTKSAPY